MIYEFPAQTEPLRQGDIFRGLPRVDLSLQEISVIEEGNQPEAVSWDSLKDRVEPITAVVGLRSVWAVIITQDCDTVRAPDITLCEIKAFSDVVKVPAPANPKAWGSLLRTQATANLKWFYLPQEPRLGLDGRHAVDFLATLRIARVDLENARNLRRGRLNTTADEHFRERLAEFFRRYPYNEWYPFTKEEFKAYRAGHPQEESIIKPYEYQQ